MISLNFKTACAALLIVLIPVAPAGAQTDTPKVSIPPGVHLRGSIDTATGEYQTKPVFKIANVELDYHLYRIRIRGLISKMEREKKDLLYKLESLDAEGTAINDWIEDLEAKRQERIARLATLQRQKQLGEEYRILMKMLPEMSKELSGKINEQNAINRKKDEINTRIVWLDKNLQTLQPLSLATAKAPKNERPTVERIQIDLGRTNYFEAHLSLNEDAVKLLKMSIEEYGKRAKEFGNLVDTVGKQFADIDAVRQKQVDVATEAQKEFVAAYNTLLENIDYEIWSRALGNIAIDTFEIVSQGKTPVGALFEASAKAVESLWVGEKGVTWRMYNPDALIGDYSAQAQAIEKHWNDTYGLNTVGGQIKRSIIATVEETALRFKDARYYRQLAREKLQPAMRRIVNRQLMAAETEELLSRKILREAGERVFKQKFAEDLGEAAAKGFKHAKLEKELASLASEIANHNAVMRELRTHVAKSAERSAILKRVIRSHGELLEKFTYKNLMFKKLPGIPSESIKPGEMSGKANIAKGVAIGLAFDALRGAYHTAGDMVAEAYWTNFLDEEMKVKGHLMDLKQTNLLWLALRSDLKTYTALHDYYTAFNEEAVLLLQQYVSKTLGDEGMHVLKADLIEDEFGVLRVKLTTRGSLVGQKVFLKGDLDYAELVQEQKENSYKKITDEVIEEQIDNINTIKEWSYKLDGKKLSDFSKNGKLRLEIQIL